MKARAMIKAALRRSGDQGTGAPKIATAPNMITLAQGEDDRVMIFGSRLRRTMGDGADLAALLPKLTARHPGVADQVITLGGLGDESFGRAVESLRIYGRTGVAQAPTAL